MKHLVAAVVFAASLSHAQEPAPSPSASATSNAKSHEWAKGGRSAERGDRLGVGPAFLEENLKPRTLMSLEELTCQTPTIVIGTPVSAESDTTDDGTVIFTDYRIQVEETIRIPARPRAQMEVTRIGGEVTTATGSRTFKSRTLPALQLGQKYLLFLSRVSGSPDAFAADIPGGTLRVTEAGVEQIDGVSFVKGLPRRGATVAFESLMGDVRIAARKCAGRSTGAGGRAPRPSEKE